MAALGEELVIIRQIEVGNFNIFSYLIGDEQAKEGLFIDPSDGHDLLLKEAKAHELAIKYIVNTHCHIDHSMGNGEMVRRTGAKVIIHEADAAGLLDTPSNILDMFGAKEPPPADILVSDGNLIQVGNVALKVIQRPATRREACVSIWTEWFSPGTRYLSVGRENGFSRRFLCGIGTIRSQ